MKVAFVIHRYHQRIGGGAEQACRMLAERIAGRPGWQVEVFTTGALDHDWNDELPAGTEVVNGVTVRRFSSASGRDPAFHDYSTALFSRPEPPSPEEQERWVDLQGPVTPALLDAVEESDADVIVFVPYLYFPSVRGLPRVRDRAVLQPAAHDELPIHLEPYRRLFVEAPAFVFFSDAERRLVERLFPVAARPQAVVGLGVEEGDGDPGAFRARHGLGDRPYLFCLGRVDAGKGTVALAEFFAEYKRRHPGPLALVYSGTVVEQPPAHDDIVVTGPIDDAGKWGGLRGALALVSPSAYESFSIVVLEAWAARRPALVNGACAVTSEHVARAGGGLWYHGFGSFEGAVERLLRESGLADALGAAGREHADEHYRWDRLIDRYCAFLERVVAARGV